MVVVAPCLFAIACCVSSASAEPAPTADAGTAPAPEPSRQELPPEHRPRLSVKLDAEKLMTGDVLHLVLDAQAAEGDQVTVVDQSFAPFEIVDKRVHSDPGKHGGKRFVFELDLLALTPGPQQVPPIELRVVTADGIVGTLATEAKPVTVSAVLGNEPNAEPKPPSAPVVVMQDDYTLLYIAEGLLAAILIALLTWFAARWWQRREKPLPPPPPPRPPWEIAVERLAELRRQKSRMIDEGRGVEFVDLVSDVVRAYLGGRFGFDGLESTTDEILSLLRANRANLGLLQEVSAYLNRCDLVKFAKVVPDGDEVDLIFAKAQDIVQFSMPTGEMAAQGAAANDGDGASAGGAP